MHRTVFESGRTTIISFAPLAKAPSIVCGTASIRPTATTAAQPTSVD
jgi:hypothetical protein